MSSDDNSDKIYKHSGFSATISDSFSSPSTSLSSLAWDGTNLLSADFASYKIYKHSGFSATINDSFSSPSIEPYGIAWDDTNLFSADASMDKIYKHSGFSSIISDSFSSPSSSAVGVAWDDTNVLSSDPTSDKIYKHSGFSATIADSFSSPSTGPFGIDWYSADYYNMKLSDGGANTLDFAVDTYSEIDADYDIYSRSTNATLKHYDIGRKKKFILGLRNISASTKDSLKTIHDLRTSLRFYRHASDMARSALVVWLGGFNLHTPVNESPQFLERLYQGTIILEEI